MIAPCFKFMIFIDEKSYKPVTAAFCKINPRKKVSYELKNDNYNIYHVECKMWKLWLIIKIRTMWKIYIWNAIIVLIAEQCIIHTLILRKLWFHYINKF